MGALPCRNHHEPGQPQGLPLHLDHLNCNATIPMAAFRLGGLPFVPLCPLWLRLSDTPSPVPTATVAVPGRRQSADTAPLPLLPTRPYYLTTNHHFNRLIAQLQTPSPGPFGFQNPNRHPRPQPSFPRKRESRNSSGQSTFLFGNPTGFRSKSGMTWIIERPKSSHRSVKTANIAPKTCSIHPHDLPKSLLK